MHERNQLAFSLTELSASFAGCFLSESYIQAFFLLIGLSVSQISLYGTLCYAAGLISYVAFGLIRSSDSFYFRLFRLASFPMALLPLVLCAAPGLPGVYWMILASAFLYHLCGGLRSSALFCIIPSLFPRRYYGRLLARCATIGCALGAVISIVNALFVREQSMLSCQILFGVSMALYLTSALTSRIMRLSEPAERDARHPKTSLRDAFTAANARLLAPHLLRGVATGGYYYFMIASFQRMTMPGALQPLMVAVGVVGNVFGVYAFGWLEKRMTTGSQIFFANVLSALCGVLTAINASPWLFFALYFLYMSSNNLTANAVPAGVIYATPAEQLPFISSMRMLVMSGASCVMIPVWGKMMDLMPVWIVMLLCAAVHVSTGCIFHRQYTDPLK